MTRAALLARRAALLPIYQNPNHDHEQQHVEVGVELAWISEQLRAMPRDPPPPKVTGNGHRGTDRAVKS